MSRRRAGFTLVELIVVVAIIAVLAALILPRLDGLLGNANHAAAASSAADASKFIETYKSSKYAYPDGWDSLTDGTNLWTPSVPPSTRGLHTELSNPSTGKLTGGNLTGAEVTALNNVGIYTLYNVDSAPAATTRPGDMFNTLTTISTGSQVAFVSQTNGTKIIDHIYRQNKIVGGVSGTLPSGTRLVAFGLGPHNVMIGKWMLEAPQYGNVDVTVTYNRLLAIFELATTTSGTTTTTKAAFKAVVGADGDLLDDMAASMNKAIN